MIGQIVHDFVAQPERTAGSELALSPGADKARSAWQREMEKAQALSWFQHGFDAGQASEQAVLRQRSSMRPENEKALSESSTGARNVMVEAARAHGKREDRELPGAVEAVRAAVRGTSWQHRAYEVNTGKDATGQASSDASTGFVEPDRSSTAAVNRGVLCTSYPGVGSQEFGATGPGCRAVRLAPADHWPESAAQSADPPVREMFQAITSSLAQEAGKNMPLRVTSTFPASSSVTLSRSVTSDLPNTPCDEPVVDHPDDTQQCTAPKKAHSTKGAPLRVHAEWTSEGVRLWLGADAHYGASIPQVTDHLIRWLSIRGVPLLSMVCNGKSVYGTELAPSALSGSEIDASIGSQTDLDATNRTDDPDVAHAYAYSLTTSSFLWRS